MVRTRPLTAKTIRLIKRHGPRVIKLKARSDSESSEAGQVSCSLSTLNKKIKGYSSGLFLRQTTSQQEGHKKPRYKERKEFFCKDMVRTRPLTAKTLRLIKRHGPRVIKLKASSDNESSEGEASKRSKAHVRSAHLIKQKKINPVLA
jgi:hypothetical protein